MNEADLLSALGELSTTILIFYAWRSQMLADQRHIENLLGVVERMAGDKLNAEVMIDNGAKKPPVNAQGVVSGAVIAIFLVAPMVARIASIFGQ